MPCHGALDPVAKAADAALERRLARGVSAASDPRPVALHQAKIIMAGRVLIILTVFAVTALLIYQARALS